MYKYLIKQALYQALLQPNSFIKYAQPNDRLPSFEQMMERMEAAQRQKGTLRPGFSLDITLSPAERARRAKLKEQAVEFLSAVPDIAPTPAPTPRSGKSVDNPLGFVPYLSSPFSLFKIYKALTE